jgi:hypothetical protein
MWTGRLGAASRSHDRLRLRRRRATFRGHDTRVYSMIIQLLCVFIMHSVEQRVLSAVKESDSLPSQKTCIVHERPNEVAHGRVLRS